MQKLDNQYPRKIVLANIFQDFLPMNEMKTNVTQKRHDRRQTVTVEIATQRTFARDEREGDVKKCNSVGHDRVAVRLASKIFYVGASPGSNPHLGEREIGKSSKTAFLVKLKKTIRRENKTEHCHKYW